MLLLPEAVEALSALAQGHRLAVFRLLVRAGAERAGSEFSRGCTPCRGTTRSRCAPRGGGAASSLRPCPAPLPPCAAFVLRGETDRRTAAAISPRSVPGLCSGCLAHPMFANRCCRSPPAAAGLGAASPIASRPSGCSTISAAAPRPFTLSRRPSSPPPTVHRLDLVRQPAGARPQLVRQPPTARPLPLFTAEDRGALAAVGFSAGCSGRRARPTDASRSRLSQPGWPHHRSR